MTQRDRELVLLRGLDNDERFSFTVYFQPNQAKSLGKILDCFEVHGAEHMLNIAKQYYYNNHGIKTLKIRYKNTTIKHSNFNRNHDNDSKMKPFELLGLNY